MRLEVPRPAPLVGVAGAEHEGVDLDLAVAEGVVGARRGHQHAGAPGRAAAPASPAVK